MRSVARLLLKIPQVCLKKKNPRNSPPRTFYSAIRTFYSAIRTFYSAIRTFYSEEKVFSTSYKINKSEPYAHFEAMKYYKTIINYDKLFFQKSPPFYPNI